LAGSYLTALITLNQGIGNGQNTAPLIPVGAAVGALAGGAVGYFYVMSLKVASNRKQPTSGDRADSAGRPPNTKAAFANEKEQ
jgi:hypothetical protein